MSNFAVIKDNKVINVIVAESKEIADEATGLNCVEYGQDNPIQIGYSYDGESFSAPETE